MALNTRFYSLCNIVPTENCKHNAKVRSPRVMMLLQYPLRFGVYNVVFTVDGLLDGFLYPPSTRYQRHQFYK